ncbi:hypothetical protein LJC27_01865 [Christensenellaceae bacterium OttesenSCG-928-M15]|nr:hypothetical protein [Christensenellaceae bacterium OttesenSCG-928-M15]
MKLIRNGIARVVENEDKAKHMMEDGWKPVDVDSQPATEDDTDAEAEAEKAKAAVKAEKAKQEKAAAKAKEGK